MTKTVLVLCLTIAGVITLHAFRALQDTTINGRITPPNGATLVYAVKGHDSVKVKPSEGAFVLAVTPGTWKLVITARPPYQTVVLQHVEVAEGEHTNVGEIRLQQ